MSANTPTDLTEQERIRTRRTPARPFSAHLNSLAVRLGDGQLRLDEVNALLQGRTLHVLVIVMCLPFLLPIPLPLLSTPFGIVIALTGIRIAFRHRPWMPGMLAERRIPAGLLTRVVQAAARVIGLLEALARPRWVGPSQLRRFHRATGLLITMAAVLLLLPVPVPASNLLPASAILLFATASLRRDGLCFVLGTVMLTASIAFFAALALLGVEAFAWLIR